MTVQRLPAVNGDDGLWGDILNQYLAKEHYNTGLDNILNGGHMTITIRSSTTAALTAPLKLTSGSLMTHEAGAVEFLTDKLYITQTPVPLYFVSVALTLGSWGSYIFDRNYGAHAYRRSYKKAI